MAGNASKSAKLDEKCVGFFKITLSLANILYKNGLHIYEINNCHWYNVYNKLANYKTVMNYHGNSLNSNSQFTNPMTDDVHIFAYTRDPNVPLGIIEIEVKTKHLIHLG